jgi:hypothetical protein
VIFSSGSSPSPPSLHESYKVIHQKKLKKRKNDGDKSVESTSKRLKEATFDDLFGSETLDASARLKKSTVAKRIVNEGKQMNAALRPIKSSKEEKEERQRSLANQKDLEAPLLAQMKANQHKWND